MTLTDSPPAIETADLCDKAADVIESNGHCKRDLYDHKQAAGTKPENCRVDIIGALNIAAHGQPVYAGRDLRVWAAEQAILARINEAAIVTWNDARGRGKQQAAKLLRDTAAGLRAGVTA
ncbi:hypothetical protein [Streptomyces sp. NBC_00140]|uniref:DUF6197 family protein n=1 Tax=Streptomyces sp. NBC_00140 TaxID=2975664 RepID=UPI0022541B93|nr:hypothetical protein [Streptomyces sp. NBC_00140]MCX5336947.1 hypothetical protein [Streptomyces sp. NBC_00140]MCX5338430.1 hypothetical protein [Streptomyces sp. NBC_00140]